MERCTNQHQPTCRSELAWKVVRTCSPRTQTFARQHACITRPAGNEHPMERQEATSCGGCRIGGLGYACTHAIAVWGGMRGPAASRVMGDSSSQVTISCIVPLSSCSRCPSAGAPQLQQSTPEEEEEERRGDRQLLIPRQGLRPAPPRTACTQCCHWQCHCCSVTHARIYHGALGCVHAYITHIKRTCRRDSHASQARQLTKCMTPCKEGKRAQEHHMEP